MEDLLADVLQLLGNSKNDALLVAVVGPAEDLCYMLKNGAGNFHKNFSLLYFF